MKHACLIRLGFYPDDPRVRREAEILAEEGLTIDIVCLRAPQETRVETFGRITAHRIMAERPKEGVLQYLRLSLGFTLKSAAKLRMLSRKQRYDLIQVHNMPDFLVFAALFDRLRGCPVIFDIHDLCVELLTVKWGRDQRGWQRRFLCLIERLSCRVASHVLTAGDGFRERLLARGVPREKITVILNAPDPRAFPYQPGRRFGQIREGARLLYYGTVAERFGTLEAVEALARLRESVPASTLRVYGRYDPSYRAALEKRIGELALDGCVTLGDWLSPEQINGEVRRSDFGLVPYLSSDFMNLAPSTKSFEYAAMGLPFVASRLDSTVRVFGETTISLARPGDPADLAEKLAVLCADPERRRAEADAARKAAAAVDYAAMRDRYVMVVSAMISGGR